MVAAFLALPTQELRYGKEASTMSVIVQLLQSLGDHPQLEPLVREAIAGNRIAGWRVDGGKIHSITLEGRNALSASCSA